MKKVLIVAAKANMIRQFNQRNILILKELGFEVHVGTNFKEFGSMDNTENNNLIHWLGEHDVISHQIDFGRKLGSFKLNFIAIEQLRDVLKQSDNWAFMHVHSPLGSVLGRIAAKFQGVKVIYTSHGFQFFKGGPLKNWLIFPIEWVLGFLTHQLIVINSQDLKVSKWLPIKHVTYIPSVGVDVTKMLATSENKKIELRAKVRGELELSENDFVLLNIGELSNRKNQRVVIEAMAKINKPRIHFVVAGVGPNLENYKRLAKTLGLADKIHFLGYRNDIQALHFAADLFVFPSLREGFGLGGFEALVDGLKVIGTKNTGMMDYLINPAYGVLIDTTNVDQIRQAIEQMMKSDYAIGQAVDRNFLMKFDNTKVDKIMKELYSKYI